MKLPLRPYQVDAIEAIEKAEARGIRRALIAHPTGTGKTVTFAHLISQRPGRAIVLAHRDELIRQTVDKINAIAPELKTGIVKAGENELHAKVVIASVQTLARTNRLEQLSTDFATIVVDEAHHAPAASYRRVLEHLGSFSDSGRLTLGFTATPERGDGAGLGKVWQEVVHRRGIREMIAAGYLVDIVGQTVGTDADFSRVHVRHGDLVESEIGDELLRSSAIDQIAGGYVEFASGRKAVAFTPTVATAYALAEALRVRGVVAEAIHGSMPMDERRSVLGRLHSGETSVVANCMILTEGFDEPSVDCIVIARPTKAHSLYIQMIGRGTRLHPGKENLLVLDVAGATDRHDLATVVNLKTAIARADDSDDSTEPGQGQVCAVCEGPCFDAAHFCEICDRPMSRETIESGAAHHYQCRAERTRKVDLFKSKLRWLPIDGGFCLPAGEVTVVILPTGEHWKVAETRNGSVEVLHDALPFGYAQGLGEDRARGAGALAKRTAGWLRLAPSPAQLSLLRRYGLSDQNIGKVTTRGQAADLITRVRARKAIRQLRGMA